MGWSDDNIECNELSCDDFEDLAISIDAKIFILIFLETMPSSRQWQASISKCKVIQAYMGKTRRIHKGLDRWD